jgi:hypothetical protein
LYIWDIKEPKPNFPKGGIDHISANAMMSYQNRLIDKVENREVVIDQKALKNHAEWYPIRDKGWIDDASLQIKQEIARLNNPVIKKQLEEASLKIEDAISRLKTSSDFK